MRGWPVIGVLGAPAFHRGGSAAAFLAAVAARGARPASPVRPGGLHRMPAAKTTESAEEAAALAPGVRRRPGQAQGERTTQQRQLPVEHHRPIRKRELRSHVHVAGNRCAMHHCATIDIRQPHRTPVPFAGVDKDDIRARNCQGSVVRRPADCSRDRVNNVTVCFNWGDGPLQARVFVVTISAMENSGHKILVVDDDPRLRDLLRRYLGEQGFTVLVAENATAMNKLWLRERFDLLVLDLMMPGEDGLSICRRLRGANDQTPIIMLTAKGEDVDRIVGLEMGADDYLPKPFNPRELIARIHAVLRRRGPAEIPGAPSETPETFAFGDFVLNLATRTLKKNDEEITLTTGEFSVLKVFARHPRQPLSREKLMEMARGREYEVFDRSLDVQISRLRKLIEPDASNPRFIQTVWGLGYVFIPDGAK